MDLYNIPGDTGGNWRRNKFVEYVVGSNNGADTVLLDEYAKLHKMNLDDRIWLAFLHGVTNAEITAIQLFHDLDYKVITPKSLAEYWEINKPKLVFITERLYVKSNNWFCILIGDFMKKCKRHPASILRLAGEGTSEERYYRLYKEIESWRYWGRFSTELFLEAIITVGLVEDLDSGNIDWYQGRTMTSGILNMMYLDEEAAHFDELRKTENTDKLNPDLIPSMNKMLTAVTRILNKRGIVCNKAQVTPQLCSFRKMFKGSYGAYYWDRQLGNLFSLQKGFGFAGKQGQIWNDVLLSRMRSHKHNVSGIRGIQTSKRGEWTDKGITGYEKEES